MVIHFKEPAYALCRFIENFITGLYVDILLLQILPMKTILVPIDFSPAAENAANYAIELALFCKSTKILFLHAFSIQPYIIDMPLSSIDIEEMEKDKMKQLTDFDKKLRKKSKNVVTELIVSTGFIVDEILRIPQEQEIGLIIMGLSSTAKSGNISNSNITSVIKLAKEPVLVIPEGAPFKRMEKIAFACDHRQTLPDEVIQKIKNQVQLFHAKLLIFEVLKKDKALSYQKALSEINLENALTDVKHSNSFPSGDNVQEEINNFITDNQADMLIMVPHNYPFLQGLFHVSTTQKMISQSQVPLLSIHE